MPQDARLANLPGSQLEALVETAADGILSIDATGTVRLCNPAAERIFARPAADIIGKNVSRLMPARYAARHDGFIARYLATGEARIIGIGRQVEGLRPDGSEFPMHLSVGEFVADGKHFFVGIVHDRSEAARESARLRELEEQINLIGRHNAVTEMGAALAHELNQPLTAVDLFLVAAERALESDPAQAKAYFDRARSEAGRAGGIVRRIRQMVERTNGEKTFFSLQDIVESAVELCRLGANDANVAILADPIPELLIFGDPVQVRQVLVNLIRNALDATRGQKRREVRIETRRAAFVDIEVSDNGPGVPAEERGQLFKPFNSSKADGLGIGLSISRGIAESHGGRLDLIEAKNGDGLQGARFRLRLPHDEREMAGTRRDRR